MLQHCKNILAVVVIFGLLGLNAYMTPKPAAAQRLPFIYHTQDDGDYRYSWAREMGAVDMRVEHGQYFWRFNCPQKPGDPLRVSIVNHRLGVWHDLRYDAGQLKPSQVSSVDIASGFADYSAWAEKWQFPPEMQSICPNGW